MSPNTNPIQGIYRKSWGYLSLTLQSLLPTGLSLRQLLLLARCPTHCVLWSFPLHPHRRTSYPATFSQPCQKIASPPTGLFLFPLLLVTQLLCFSLPAPLALFHPGSQSHDPCKRVSQTAQEPQACLEGERSSTSKCFCLVPDTSLTGGCLLINSQLP